MTSSIPKITQLGSKFGSEPKLISSRDPVLPHLGTYVIDTPRDKNWSWRQQCLHYHETHRGVLCAMKVNPLPEIIPKRCDLRTLPEQQEEASLGSASESSSASVSLSGQHATDSVIHGVNGGRLGLSASRPRTRSLSPLNSTRTKEKRGERNLEHLMEKPFHGLVTLRPTNKRSPNKRLTTSVPCYTSLCTLKEIQTSNLWRAKPIKHEHLGDFRAASIQHSTQSKQNGLKNKPCENGAQECDAKSSVLGPNGKSGDAYLKLKPLAERNGNHDDVTRAVGGSTKFQPLEIPPVKHIGHTSRYKEWSNMRLAEVLKDRPVPGGAHPLIEGKRIHMTGLSEVEYHAGDECQGTEVDRSWLHVVNTPLVDKDMYDRYARVKLV